MKWYQKLNININLKPITDTEVMLFAKQLAVILKSGLTLVDGMEILVEQSKGNFKKILKSILNELYTGATLHDTLQNFHKHFPPIFTSMVETGEQSGTLEESLFTLSEQLRKGIEVKRKIKSAMMYPALVFFAVFGLAMAIGLFVLPKIVPLFNSLDTDLPTMTKILLTVANFLDQHGLLLAVALVIGGVGLVVILKQKFLQPFTHRALLKLPVIGPIIQEINLERLSRTLATLLISGFTLDHSLRVAAKTTTNYVYRKEIEAAARNIESGLNLGEVLGVNNQLFGTMLPKMVTVGERSGNLDDTLTYLSDYYRERIEEVLNNLAKIIEPLMLIFVGVIVGGLALAILGPIYEITGSLRN